MYRNSNFKTSYKNDYFIVEYQNYEFKFREYPSTDFFHAVDGYLKYYKINDEDIIIDCGAYQGTFTILASKLVGNKGIIISFEPDIDNYNKLLHNININDVKNVKTINKGLWSKNTELKLAVNNQGSSFFNENSLKSINVPVVSLDDQLGDLGIENVNFIKGDIEGSEIETIKGAKEILKKTNVNLAIASYHEINGAKTYFELEKILKTLGYSSKTEFPSHLTTYAKKDY